MDRPQDLVRRIALRNVAARPRADHPDHRVRVLVRRQRDDLRRRASLRDLACRSQASAARHAHIEQDDVGAFAHRQLDRVLGVVGGPDETERGVRSDQRAEDVDDRFLVVGDRDADRSPDVSSGSPFAPLTSGSFRSVAVPVPSEGLVVRYLERGIGTHLTWDDGSFAQSGMTPADQWGRRFDRRSPDRRSRIGPRPNGPSRGGGTLSP